MADATLLTLFQELMQSYDSTIDTSAGSKFRTEVMDPFLTRIGDNPLDSDLESFLVSRLEVEHPTLDSSSFSGIRDLVVRPMVTMLEPLRREINGVKIRQSLQNYDQMTKEELNGLLGNFFVSVNDGSLATGSVRIFFLSPQSVVVPSTSVFYTDSGLEYVPVSSSAISSSEMAFNVSGNEYYFDVDVQASESGEDYNVGGGQIVRVDGVLSASRVSNPLPITGGKNEETNAEAVTRARNSLTTRTLATKRGVKVVLSEEFPTIEDIKVVGFGDPEMVRDIVEGPVSVSDVPGGVPNSDVDVTANIHIGGKTDVYVKTPDDSLTANSIEVQNVTNYGQIIQSSGTGVVSAGTYGSPLKQNLTDVNGFFRDVSADETYFILIDDKEFEILSVTGDTTLAFDASSNTITHPRININYQIVRKEKDGFIKVPMTNLAAVDSDGNLILNGGTPVRVIPGSSSNEAFLNSAGNTVALTANIAVDGNIVNPVFRPTSLSIIDQTAGTEVDAPKADMGYAVTLGDFSGGAAAVKATGGVRHYLSSLTNAKTSQIAVDYDDFNRDIEYSFSKAVWTDADGNTFQIKTGLTNSIFSYPNVRWSATGSVNYFYILSSLVSTHSLTKGDWVILGESGSNVTFAQRILMIEDVGTADVVISASNYRKVTVRFDGASGEFAFVVSSNTADPDLRLIKGIHADSLTADGRGQYYVDLDLECTAVGTDGNIKSGTFLTPSGMYVEGYKLLSQSAGESFSTRDVPVVHLTNYTSNLNLTLSSTAVDFKLSYETGTDLTTYQDFVEDEENRIVGEDILIKHYKPVYSTLQISSTGLVSADGLNYLQEFVESLDRVFEVSDLVSFLYDKGATRVKLPIEIILNRQNSNREIYKSILVDRIEIDSDEKFYFSTDSTFTVI